MADTALKTEEEKKEYFDPPEVLDEKCTQLAKWIKESAHFIAFTGAGISTSTGIPDFRSGVNTVLPTGPGAWEKLATGFKSKEKYKRTPMASAIPSYTHMALVKLMNEGFLKFLISQNCDGLHRKSGIPASKIAEVHGNTNTERCIKCKREYLRDFHTRNAKDVHDHQTGRKCAAQGCGGDLYDTIINFGESLPEKELDDGFIQSQLADLCLTMGSSLRVTPACNMPKTTADLKGRLVIVNLQKTPLDDQAALIIHGMCDDVMRRVMEKMKLEVPLFTLRRLIQARIEEVKEKRIIKIEGVDSEGIPFSLFSKITTNFGAGPIEATKEPFIFIIPEDCPFEAKFNLYFQGHYGEPPAEINIPLIENCEKLYSLEYTPLKPDKSNWDSIICII